MKKSLTELLRPQKITDIIGQLHLVNAKNGVIQKIIEQHFLPSLILYGPPGTGKTSLALIISNQLNYQYQIFNAAIDKKQDLVNLINQTTADKPIVIIIEEIHRLNRDRQDILLQYLEKRSFILIACTTENPYFSVNPALRSRCLLLEFKRITTNEMVQGLTKIFNEQQTQIAENFNISVLEQICHLAAGDLRYALNLIETLISLYPNTKITQSLVATVINQGQLWNFKNGDELHDLKSALQKSIRGSDPDAAVYYLARMLASGDYEALLRRLLIIAYEDIGLANPSATLRVFTAIQAFREIGMPEGIIPLGLVVIEMALSEKSNSANQAVQTAYQDILNGAIYPIPSHLTSKGQKSYLYPPNFPNSYISQQYLPNELQNKQYYRPRLHNKYEKKLYEYYQNLKKQL